MRFLRKIFGIKDYVYIMQHNGFISKDVEDDLRKQANDYISNDLNKFFRQKIEYVEFYNFGDNTFNIMTTFDTYKSKIWGIMIYEIYAFLKTLNLIAFKDYTVTSKSFNGSGQEIVVYKIKI